MSSFPLATESGPLPTVVALSLAGHRVTPPFDR